MYYKGEKVKKVEKPFIVKCSNCNSHDVWVYALENDDVMIKCKRCGSYIRVGAYNELEYKEENYD